MTHAATIITIDEAIAGPALRERVGRVAAGLRGLGVGRGDCICILMRNDSAFLEATLAAQQLGAYAVPLNWHFRRDELLYVIGDCHPKVLLVHDDLLGEVVTDLAATLKVVVVPAPPALRRAFRSPPLPATATGHEFWPDWIGALEPLREEAGPAPDSVIYTSGTTGNPKGVRRRPLAPELAQAAARMRAAVYGIGPGDRVLMTAPLYHAAPNFFSLRAVRLAERLVLLPRFEAEEFLAAIERHGITHVYAVPTMFVKLLALPAQMRDRHDLSSLRFVLHAGGPCAPAVKQAMIDWLGPVINEYYGSTEHGPLTFCTSAEWLAHPGTVGRAAPDCMLAIEDDEGNRLPTGGIGEVLGRNMAHSDFTYSGRQAERDALQRGDLILTGDVGYLDADGFLYLCDRKRDMVISGGVNIYPAEIEGVLAEMPGVADSAVFGLPDDLYGETLMAIVQPRADAQLEPGAIRQFLAARLAAYKVPALIEIHEHLPREESGKIRKRLLRDSALKARQREREPSPRSVR
ncbi:MAG: AMP-binding protein [Rhizobiaceae bacterium]|nr:AMP-binding protein [Rhizobiaceae bacterium]